jgi:hypothetical protein
MQVFDHSGVGVVTALLASADVADARVRTTRCEGLGVQADRRHVFGVDRPVAILCREVFNGVGTRRPEAHAAADQYQGNDPCTHQPDSSE